MEIKLPAEQLKLLSQWSEAGHGFVPVTIYRAPPPYISTWEPGDVLAEQGDAYLQLSRDGEIKDAVPETHLPT